ncbi:5'-methylthioadenosine/S-adenosylhomocysteine nucleosidase family protein [Novosphingobium lindaniclasticum]
MMDEKANRQYFDIALVVPLEEELIQVMDHFASLENRSTDSVFCHVVNSGTPDIRMIVIQQQGMGKTHAINAANSLFKEYEIGLLVCLGIAGSLTDDLHLASVCYSGGIADVLDNNKITDVDGPDEEPDEADTEFSPCHYSTPDKFTQAFGFARTQPDVRPAYLMWQELREEFALAAVPHEVPAPGGKSERIGKPTTKNGIIACGMVSKSKIYNNKLRAIDRAVLAVETESGGIFAQAKYHGEVPAMTIRGISDYADKDKKKLEQASKGGVRELAAGNAASFLHFQINENPYFQKVLAGQRAGGQTALALASKPQDPDILVKTLEAIGSDIDDSLRKLSPEYKLQEKGYRLPLPRIRRKPEGDGTDASEHPEGVRDALTRKDRIVLILPRTYPDQSLPWIIANDLLTAEFGDRQAVPVVIDGEAIRGKQSTFLGAVDYDLAELQKHAGARLVFVVENMPFGHKHRIETILDELEKYPDAKCVFIARGDDALVGESAFETRSAATHYDSCSISFLEIAHFIQKNFGMSGGDSEVVAKRLRDTFNQFRLDAHPTYFAGIPKETLSALLQANRRAELIQLAVDGFLTFIVAGDKSDVSLGRTTRARFLRSLALEMKLEKRSFDQVALVSFTKEFADRHDFDIDPFAFLRGFEDQGIIHFESDRVQISLPFIESYLLAVELAAKPGAAERYFVINEDFDFATFDLYAEIGASPGIFGRVYEELDAAANELKAGNNEEPILLGEGIAPANIRKRDATERLKKRLQTAVEAVKNGSSNLQEKQNLLDLQDRVREEAGKQRDVHDEEADQKWADRIAPINRVGLIWTVGTVLLGSGAEHLEAPEKRKLTALLVSSAAVFIDHWSRVQAEFDFEALKNAITTDEALADMPGPDDLAEKRKFVTGLIDLFEYTAMADPVRRTMTFLCEQARQRVLAPSIEAADVNGVMENLIKGSWLLDVDPARGRRPLLEAMKELPRAAFLRMTMVSHYMTRMYWAHGKADDKLALLDAADNMLKPLEIDLDKSKLKRLIEREGKA